MVISFRSTFSEPSNLAELKIIKQGQKNLLELHKVLVNVCTVNLNNCQAKKTIMSKMSKVSVSLHI